MRAIPTKHIKAGSVLAENLYTSEGRILVKRGVELTPQLMEKIETNKIFTVYIESKHSDVEVNRLLEQSFRVKGMLIIRNLFETASKDESILGIHEALRLYAEDVLYELRSYQKLPIEYVDIKNVDAYIYSSALNAALLSALIAWDLGYNNDLVKEIFLGAIYHDIGIALLPKDVINKTTALTTEEKMMILNHPKIGHDYLKDKSFISAYIKAITLQHHEHIDGSGYPKRLKEVDINRIAQIVGIADIYDAMTSDRPYKRAVVPKVAIEYIVAVKGKKFIKEVAEAFIARIAPYPRGTLVKLSNDEVAVVEELNENWPLRPVIRVIYKKGIHYDYETLDLMQHQNILIEDVVYDNI
jgi:HD-GYP domain-containing protein (c-di-GMP phosphodiesterase class II)